MSKFNDYKVFEDDIIKTLKRQFKPSIGELFIGGTVDLFIDIGFYNVFRNVDPRVGLRDSEIDLNEEVYRHFIDSNYRHSFIDCHGDPDEVAKLKEKAVKGLKELIEKTQ